MRRPFRGLILGALAIVLGAPLGIARAEPAGVIDPVGRVGTVIAAAGDIACNPGSPRYGDGQGSGLKCRQLATSNLLVSGRYDAVLALGDNQYPDGEYAHFMASYKQSWGRVKSITRPVPGNHDYHTPRASGYFRYFGAAAGNPAKGYYSFDLGDWHLIALNSNCSDVGGCKRGSAQVRWLRADLEAHASARCTLAYWHHPLFSSGVHGSNSTYTAFWNELYAAGADVVLVGHDHDYERFAPQTPTGAPDATRGIRQFVVGTGGSGLRRFKRIQANSQVRDNETFGILRLALRPAGYAWRFVPAVGSFTDSGTGGCH
jgi:hypothetical protein